MFLSLIDFAFIKHAKEEPTKEFLYISVSYELPSVFSQFIIDTKATNQVIYHFLCRKIRS